MKKYVFYVAAIVVLIAGYYLIFSFPKPVAEPSLPDGGINPDVSTSTDKQAEARENVSEGFISATGPDRLTITLREDEGSRETITNFEGIEFVDAKNNPYKREDILPDSEIELTKSITAGTNGITHEKIIRIRILNFPQYQEYKNELYNVAFKYPKSWKPDESTVEAGGVRLGYKGGRGFFEIGALTAVDGSLEETAKKEALKSKDKYGESATIENIKVAGYDCVKIVPGESDGTRSETVSALVVAYPYLLAIGHSEYEYFILSAQSDYFEQLIKTLTFPRKTKPSSESSEIKITSLKDNDIVKSPLVIDGEALGNWYFEGVFPVELLDGNGKSVVKVNAESIGDWMSADFVPFNAKLEFKAPATETGTLVFKNDNPSGLKEKEKTFSIKIRFK